MKKVILTTILCLLGLSVNAAKLDVSHIDDPTTKGDYDSPALNKFSAENDGDYKGRNEGVVHLNSTASVNKNLGLSKVVIKQTSKQSAQLDNLETNAGEMVQKIEDDRGNVTSNQDKIYNNTKKILSEARNYASHIELEHLGQEQDPTVTSAFKCKDIEDCNHLTDSRVIDECKPGEMLHWDGDLWKCIGMFENPKGPSCNQDQWMTTLPGGDKACVDYIYQWGQKQGVCLSGIKTDVTYCFKKKTSKDPGVIIGDGKCYGPKPKNKVTDCNANWQIGSWGSCSKSCGGGVKYRSVTCPANYKCTAAKPATSQSCNTQVCTTSWKVGAWGTCSKSCGGGVQSRSVTCPSGYVCTGSKPTASQSCNTQKCPDPCAHCSGASSKDNYMACMSSCQNGGGSSSGNCGANGCGNLNQSGGTTGQQGGGGYGH